MKMISIADLHCQMPTNLPDGDILTISGDLTWRGRFNEVKQVADWLTTLDFKYIVVIAGNHDFCFEHPIEKLAAEQYLKDRHIIYLNESGCEIEGRKFWGSPWTPWFHDWAFNGYRQTMGIEHWSKIPENLDVLLCHGPPMGFGDRCEDGERVGDSDLLDAIKIKKPKKVFYGHIHEDVGHWTVGASECYNCSIGPFFGAQSHFAPQVTAITGI